MKLLNCYLPIFVLCVLCIATTPYARDGSAVPDSTKAAAVDSIGLLDTLPAAQAADSGLKQDAGSESESSRMYRSSVSRMRRDVPQQNEAPDSIMKQRRIKASEPEVAKVSQPKRADSIAVAQNNNPAPKPPAKVKVKKSSILIAAGSCALIGCGIVAYLIKNSKKDDLSSQNNRIPPPPDPPL